MPPPEQLALELSATAGDMSAFGAIEKQMKRVTQQMTKSMGNTFDSIRRLYQTQMPRAAPAERAEMESALGKLDALQQKSNETVASIISSQEALFRALSGTVDKTAELMKAEAEADGQAMSTEESRKKAIEMIDEMASSLLKGGKAAGKQEAQFELLNKALDEQVQLLKEAAKEEMPDLAGAPPTEKMLEPREVGLPEIPSFPEVRALQAQRLGDLIDLQVAAAEQGVQFSADAVQSWMTQASAARGAAVASTAMLHLQKAQEAAQTGITEALTKVEAAVEEQARQAAALPPIKAVARPAEDAGPDDDDLTALEKWNKKVDEAKQAMKEKLALDKASGKAFKTTVRHTYNTARAIDVMSSAMQGVTLGLSIATGNMYGLAMAAYMLRRALGPVVAVITVLTIAIAAVLKVFDVFYNTIKMVVGFIQKVAIAAFKKLRKEIEENGIAAQDAINHFSAIAGSLEQGTKMWMVASTWAQRYNKDLQDTRKTLVALWKQGILNEKMMKATIALSSAWQMSLEEAADALAGAVGEEEENVEALKEYGIEIANLTDKTNRLAVATDVADAVLDRFGETLEQNTKSLSSAIQGVKTSMQVFWETLLEPIVSNMIAPLVNAVGNFAASLGQLVRQLWLTKGAQDYFNETISEAKEVIKEYTPELRLLANAARFVVAYGFVLLQMALRATVKLAERLLNWARGIIGVFKRMARTIKPLADLFRLLNQNWKELTFTSLLQAFKNIEDNLPWGLVLLIEILKTAWAGIKEWLLKPILSFFEGLFTALGIWFTGEDETLNERIRKFFERIREHITTFGVFIQNVAGLAGFLLGVALGELSKALGGLFEIVLAILQGDFGAIPGIWKGTWDEIFESAGKTKTEWDRRVGDTWESFGDVLDGVFGEKSSLMIKTFALDATAMMGGLTSEVLKFMGILQEGPQFSEYWAEQRYGGAQSTAQPGFLEGLGAGIRTAVAGLSTILLEELDKLTVKALLWLDENLEAVKEKILTKLTELGTEGPEVLLDSFVIGMENIKPDLEALGEAAVEAVWEGMVSLDSWLETRIKNMFGSSVVDAIKGIMEQDSPSRVMARIGEDNVRGYMMGMQSESNRLAGAAPIMGGLATVGGLGGGGNTYISVTVTGNNISSRDDAEQLADQVANQIMGKLKARGVNRTGRF